MIKAVLFDFDGVLTLDKTGSMSIINYLAEKTAIPKDFLSETYGQYNDGLLLGQFTHEDIWDDFCRELGCALDIRLLSDAFASTKLDEEMMAYVKELKKKYLIGMITDNKADRMKKIASVNEFDKIFDVMTVSAEVGTGKRDVKIYELTLEKLKVKPEECIFIDNTAKNLIAPEKMGIKTVLFNDENRNIWRFENQIEDLLTK